MRHIRVVICEVDDQSPDTMTELAAFDLLALDVATLAPQTALDDLEQTTYSRSASTGRPHRGGSVPGRPSRAAGILKMQSSSFLLHDPCTGMGDKGLLILRQEACYFAFGRSNPNTGPS
jgi:hypothetical protein